MYIPPMIIPVTEEIGMPREAVRQAAKHRHQTPARLRGDVHQRLDVELARHLELVEEKIGAERRIDLSRRRALESDQRIDRLSIQPHAGLAVAVQQIEERLIANVDLQ